MPFTRKLLSALLGALALAAVMLAGVGPASAHDVAESSSPAAGATVATAPEQVSVTFNNNPLGLGAEFAVKDAAGKDWADGPVEIVDNVAAQKLKPGAPAGQYTVVWRVASADGHPIEGSFTFTATAGAEGSTAGAVESAAAAPVPAVGTAQPGATAEPEAAADSAQPFAWSIVIFVAVAIGILVTLGLMTKRKLAPGRGGQR